MDLGRKTGGNVCGQLLAELGKTFFRAHFFPLVLSVSDKNGDWVLQTVMINNYDTVTLTE